MSINASQRPVARRHATQLDATREEPVTVSLDFVLLGRHIRRKAAAPYIRIDRGTTRRLCTAALHGGTEGHRLKKGAKKGSHSVSVVSATGLTLIPTKKPSISINTIDQLVGGYPRKMKGSIVIAGRDYLSRRCVQEQFDVNYTTIGKWVKNGLLPAPLRLGNRLYFDRTAVETRILATAR
jgi:hypothetical protein